MDPTFSPTPTPTPTPTPAPTPTPPASPVPPASTSEPVSPVINPVSASVPGVAASNLGESINPIVQPSGSEPVAPVNPVVKPSGFGVTDPIMMPEKPQAPDPVEEELKAPMKAAAPVPGSIGSAVSGPTTGAAAAEVPNVDAATGDNGFPKTASTQSVSFNDPAVQNDMAQPANASAQTAKKKTNKTTLIALIAVASVIVIVLVVILIMQLMSGNQANSSSSSSNSSSSEQSNSSGGSAVSEEEEVEPVPEASTVAPVSCTYSASGEDGSVMSSGVVFAISDNTINGVNTFEERVLADGTSEDNSSALSFAEFLSSRTNDSTAMSAYVDEDGKILVSLDEFGTALQELMNKNENGYVYACTVNQ